MNKLGKFGFNVKWLGSSVSGLVVIVGAFVIWLSLAYNKPELTSIGVWFVVGGLLSAIFIALIMRLISKLK